MLLKDARAFGLTHPLTPSLAGREDMRCASRAVT